MYISRSKLHSFNCFNQLKRRCFHQSIVNYDKEIARGSQPFFNGNLLIPTLIHPTKWVAKFMELRKDDDLKSILGVSRINRIFALAAYSHNNNNNNNNNINQHKIELLLPNLEYKILIPCTLINPGELNEQVKIESHHSTHLKNLIDSYGINNNIPQITQTHLDSNYEKINSNRTLLVCSHNSRDCRCGDFGPQLVNKLSTLLNLSNPKTDSKTDLYSVSHVGGHAYAANMFIYPQGVSLGFGGAPDEKTIESSLQSVASCQDYWTDPALHPFLRGLVGCKDNKSKSQSV